MTYSPWTKNSGFIHIRPSYDSIEKIKFKLDETYFIVLELIYLHLIFWKYKKNLLLDKDKLERFQTKPPAPKIEPSIDEKKIEMEVIDLAQEILAPFREYIKTGEKVLFYYMPKIVNRTLILLSALTVAGIMSWIFFGWFYLNEPEIPWGITIAIMLGLMMFGAIFGMGGPCFILLYLSGRFSKFIFTSDKIIMSQFSKIGSTPYSNISALTYKDVKRALHITIKLVEPLDSDQFIEKKTLILNFVQKELDIYRKIQSLRVKHMKK
jgi:hypothetical protein